MPTSTIPYDPSLVLGMVVDPAKIEVLENIADLQKPVDAARDRVNALLRQKLSLDMTARELLSLGAQPEDLKDFNKNIKTVTKDILAAALDLSSAVITAEAAIAQQRSSGAQQQIGSQIQSPLDFSASELKAMPLSSDTMNLDVQYFRYESEDEKNTSTTDSISAFVGAKVSSFLGASWGTHAATASNHAVSSARKNRNLLGTVVICANCTHKQAQVFSPMVLDVDNAIENFVAYSGQPWEGNTDSETMLELATKEISTDETEKGMPVLVGASYGSSFVGFVHFEQAEGTTSYQDLQSSARNASTAIESGLFLGGSSGSFGIDQQMAKSLQSLLSTSNLQSHCSVITMGLIPSIKSNTVKTVVEGLKGGPKEHMAQLAAMQNSSNAGITSIAAMADVAKKGQSIEQMKTDYIKASVDAVAAVDTQQNQVIDMNSLMTALDDFVEKAGEGEGGVPINFYLKYVTQRTIANAWMQKYYPELLHPSDDDDEEEEDDEKEKDDDKEE